MITPVAVSVYNTLSARVADSMYKWQRERGEPRERAGVARGGGAGVARGWRGVLGDVLRFMFHVKRLRERKAGKVSRFHGVAEGGRPLGFDTRRRVIPPFIYREKWLFTWQHCLYLIKTILGVGTTYPLPNNRCPCHNVIRVLLCHAGETHAFHRTYYRT